MEHSFSFEAYSHLRMAIGHLLQKAEGVIFKDHQLVAPLNRLCGFDENDESMTAVDVDMISKAITRRKGSNSVVSFNEFLRKESDYYLHTEKDKDGVVTVACSRSYSGDDLRTAGDDDVNILLSFDLDDEYTDASQGGGWPKMKENLIAFLRGRKIEAKKKEKKNGKRRRKKITNAKESNNIPSINANFSTNRPITPATASLTTTSTQTNPSPSTKSPAPKRGKKSSSNLSASNIGSGVAPLQEGDYSKVANNSKSVESAQMSGDSNQLNIYNIPLKVCQRKISQD